MDIRGGGSVHHILFSEYSREQMEAVTKWREKARYDPGPETDAIIEAKIQ